VIRNYNSYFERAILTFDLNFILIQFSLRYIIMFKKLFSIVYCIVKKNTYLR